jgi:hypothetical protein
LESIFPLERKWIRAFGTRKSQIPFRRKGSELCAFRSKKASTWNQWKSGVLSHHVAALACLSLFRSFLSPFRITHGRALQLVK